MKNVTAIVAIYKIQTMLGLDLLIVVIEDNIDIIEYYFGDSINREAAEMFKRTAVKEYPLLTKLFGEPTIAITNTVVKEKGLCRNFHFHNRLN